MSSSWIWVANASASAAHYSYPVAPGYTPIVLPAYITSPIRFIRARCGHQTATGATGYGQFSIAVDPGRKFIVGQGSVQENNSAGEQQNVTLVSLFTGPTTNEPMERTEWWDAAPVSFDPANDGLIVTIDYNGPTPDQWWTVLHFLCP